MSQKQVSAAVLYFFLRFVFATNFFILIVVIESKYLSTNFETVNKNYLQYLNTNILIK